MTKILTLLSNDETKTYGTVTIEGHDFPADPSLIVWNGKAFKAGFAEGPGNPYQEQDVVFIKIGDVDA